MAQHNGLQQYPQLLKSFLLSTGLPETEEGVTRLGETLTPTIDIWNGRREWALLRGELWYSRRITIAAGGAGTNGGIALYCPNQGGICSVLVAMSATPGAAGQQLSMYAHSLTSSATILASLPTSAFGVPCDRRRQGTQAASQSSIQSGTPAGIVAGGFECEVQQDSAVVRAMPFTNLPQVLYAGDLIVIWNNTQNATLAVNLLWYDRKCVANEVRG